MTPRTWALAVLVVALVVGVNVVFGGSGAVDGPQSSSYSTSPTGTAALAALLDRAGHRVRRLRAPLERRAPPAGSTTFVLDPIRLDDDEARALTTFVRDGGRLVAAGRGVERLAAELQAGAPVLGNDAPSTLLVAAPAPETAGVREVRESGQRAWAGGGGGLPLLAADGPVGAVAIDVPADANAATSPAGSGAASPDGSGSAASTGATSAPASGPGSAPGRLLLLADAGPLQNRLLDEADDAVLAVGLAGAPSRSVAFVESVHGYAEPSGLAAIPNRWRWAAGGLALAVLLFGWARGRRFGPPELAERELDPPRRAYVEAVAASLARTDDRAGAVRPVHAAARAALARRAGLDAGADEAAWRRAAAQFELPEDEQRALAEPGLPDLLATGRALARLVPRGSPVDA